jgi:hypothetical protein
MRIGNLVRDKDTGLTGIITEAWIDENDGTAVVVEFLEAAHQEVYWSHSAQQLENLSE